MHQRMLDVEVFWVVKDSNHLPICILLLAILLLFVLLLRGVGCGVFVLDGRVAVLRGLSHDERESLETRLKRIEGSYHKNWSLARKEGVSRC